MDELLSSEKFLLIRKYLLPIGLILLALICFIYGLTVFFGQKQKTQDNSFLSENQMRQVSATPAKSLIVDIEGAVQHPGVYEMPSESRIKDVLVKAGGLTATANREAVAKSVNLAMKVVDSMKLYIPLQNDTNTQVLGAQTSDIGTLTNASGTININSASPQELDGLPGVGTVTANKIINGRPYTDLQDLVTKKVVTQKVFDKIKASISLY